MSNIVPVDLPDIQGLSDTRGLFLPKVGITGRRHPLRLGWVSGVQSTISLSDLLVSVSSEQKGTHMSRLVQLLEGWAEPCTPDACSRFLAQVQALLNAEQAHLHLRFPFFLQKPAPISKASALMDYPVELECHASNGSIQFSQSIQIPVTSLCPCSKQISAYGAHNQRCHIQVRVQGTVLDDWQFPNWIEPIEALSSAPLYPVLKRIDEKFVTELAYDNPKFVEDIVRDTVLYLQKIKGWSYFSVSAESIESIHHHNAYAFLDSTNLKIL